jgi:hypothetical protein
MAGKATELTFQNDMLKHLVASGWLLGSAANTIANSRCIPKTSWVLSKTHKMRSGRNSARFIHPILSRNFWSVLPVSSAKPIPMQPQGCAHV